MRVYAVESGSGSRLGRRLILLALLVVVVLAALVYLVVAHQVVIPGITERMYPIHFQEGIGRVAERYGVDPYLVAAVAREESRFDPKAVSRAGAIGLMQLMPETAEWIVGLDSWQGPEEPVLTDPDDSLELGACYLAFLLRRFNGDVRASVAAYNAGQGVVGRWVEEEGGSLELEDIRFPETRAFVERVEDTLELYRRVHPDVFAGGGGDA